jgi:lipoprotein signal peptidase
MAGRTERLLTLAVLMLSLAAIDLWLKLAVSTPDWAFHHRSALWAVACTLLLVAVVPLTRLPSNVVTVGAGFFAGGVLGNLISAGTDDLTVPNPFAFATPDGWFAFNAADTFIVAGNLLLMVGLCAFVIRHREELRVRLAPARARRDR